MSEFIAGVNFTVLLLGLMGVWFGNLRINGIVNYKSKDAGLINKIILSVLIGVFMWFVVYVVI